MLCCYSSLFGFWWSFFCCASQVCTVDSNSLLWIFLKAFFFSPWIANQIVQTDYSCVFVFGYWLSGFHEPAGANLCPLRFLSYSVIRERERERERAALACLYFTFTISNQAAGGIIFRICGMLSNAFTLLVGLAFIS